MSIAHRSAIRFLFVAVLAVFPASLAAQNFVTPTIAQTPGVSPSGLTTGQFTIVNNAAGASYTDPHVSSDLVCYSTSDNNGAFTVRYFNLVTGIDSQIPNPDITQYQDFLCDVRGSAIAFTRASMTTDQIMTFDISVSGAQPVQISPTTVFARPQSFSSRYMLHVPTRFCVAPVSCYSYQ